MDRSELVLASLSPAKGATHSPVQVQKLFFLIDKKIPDSMDGPLFDFQPNDYGPFDKAVYQELEGLAEAGLVELGYLGRMQTYKLTPDGQTEGQRLVDTLPERARDFIKTASQFVRTLSFQQLVSAIYAAYPEMKVNSVFQE